MESTNGDSSNIGSKNDFSAQNTPDDVMDGDLDGAVNSGSGQAARIRNTAAVQLINNTVKQTESTSAAIPVTVRTAAEQPKKAETEYVKELNNTRAGTNNNCNDTVCAYLNNLTN